MFDTILLYVKSLINSGQLTKGIIALKSAIAIVVVVTIVCLAIKLLKKFVSSLIAFLIIFALLTGSGFVYLTKLGAVAEKVVGTASEYVNVISGENNSSETSDTQGFTLDLIP